MLSQSNKRAWSTSLEIRTTRKSNGWEHDSVADPGSEQMGTPGDLGACNFGPIIRILKIILRKIGLSLHGFAHANRFLLTK